MKNAKIAGLPPLPDKRYFTIGETAELCRVKPHVLRYWEQEFGMLKPIKRRGSRRYYQQKDVMMVRQIRELLYEKGFTISGARLQLKQGNRQVPTPFPEVESSAAKPKKITQAPKAQELLPTIISSLEKLLAYLKQPTQA